MACAKGEYIVQTDGDIVMANDFIADHIRLARRNSYAKGVRVRLEKEISDAICRQPRRKCPTLFSKGLMNRHKALRFIPPAHWFACHFKERQGLRLRLQYGVLQNRLVESQRIRRGI